MLPFHELYLIYYNIENKWSEVHAFDIEIPFVQILIFLDRWTSFFIVNSVKYMIIFI